MALVRCILVKFLKVACHCFPRFLDVPTFHHQVPPRPPRRERSQRRKWELWARMMSGNFAEMTTSTPFRDLLHAAHLRHVVDVISMTQKFEETRSVLYNIKGFVGQKRKVKADKTVRLCSKQFKQHESLFLLFSRLPRQLGIDMEQHTKFLDMI